MIDRVILDVQLGHPEVTREPVRANERRASRVEPGQRLARNRQQLTVAPEILRTCRDAGRCDGGADRVVIVGHLERAETLIADEEGIGREGRAAHPAAKPGEKFHTSVPGWCADNTRTTQGTPMRS